MQKRRIKCRFRYFSFVLTSRLKRFALSQIVAKQVPSKHVVAQAVYHRQVMIIGRVRVRDDVIGLCGVVEHAVFHAVAVRAVRNVIFLVCGIDKLVVDFRAVERAKYDFVFKRQERLHL